MKLAINYQRAASGPASARGYSESVRERGGSVGNGSAARDNASPARTGSYNKEKR